MGFNQNVIDIITKHCENKRLIVTTRNSVMFGGIKNTDIHISRHDDFNFTVNIDWDYSGFRDTAGLANNILDKIDDALDAHEAKKYDVPSLYPKMIFNSVYGLTAKEHMDYIKYSKFDVAMTGLLNERFSMTKVPSIKNVIFNNPATIVFWSDGTKTIVKAQDGDIFDPEKGLAMAVSKKVFGNKGNYCEKLKKWLPKEDSNN